MEDKIFIQVLTKESQELLSDFAEEVEGHVNPTDVPTVYWISSDKAEDFRVFCNENNIGFQEEDLNADFNIIGGKNSLRESNYIKNYVNKL